MFTLTLQWTDSVVVKSWVPVSGTCVQGFYIQYSLNKCYNYCNILNLQSKLHLSLTFSHFWSLVLFNSPNWVPLVSCLKEHLTVTVQNTVGFTMVLSGFKCEWWFLHFHNFTPFFGKKGQFNTLCLPPVAHPCGWGPCAYICLVRNSCLFLCIILTTVSGITLTLQIM